MITRIIVIFKSILKSRTESQDVQLLNKKKKATDQTQISQTIPWHRVAATTKFRDYVSTFQNPPTPIHGFIQHSATIGCNLRGS